MAAWLSILDIWLWSSSNTHSILCFNLVCCRCWLMVCSELPIEPHLHVRMTMATMNAQQKKPAVRWRG